MGWKHFDYYFIIFIFDMCYSDFTGSGWFAIVEPGWGTDGAFIWDVRHDCFL